MVRVISCHHFVSQEVFQSQQEPLSFCCSQGKVLIATEDRNINVHDLDSRGNILHSFSSIDQVSQLIYCDSGNYIATLERKFTKHLTTVTHVRIYFNWWIEQRGQPIEVRIAGSSPPFGLGAWSDHFETVELPLKRAAMCIACCKTTAAIAVSLGKTISVFCFSAKPSETSKLRPRDFSHFIDIEMNFPVRELSMCKNYFACTSINKVQVFKVSIVKEVAASEADNSKKNVRGSDLDEHFVEWQFEPCVDSSPDLTWENELKKVLHPNSFPISISLRSIERENQSADLPPRNYEVIGPVLTVNGYHLKVKLDPNAFDLWPSLSSTNIDSVTLLYREFEFEDVEFHLMSLQLISFYESDHYDQSLDPLHAAAVASQESFSSLPWSTSNLDAQPPLKAIGCFFSTVKEGFLYDVTEETKLIGSYNYTSSLKSAVLDSMFLHALTDAGLETYTLHLSHCAFRYVEAVDGITNACPDYSSPICLLGLRPFLGATKLVIAENYLIVVSSLEDMTQSTDDNDYGNCTLYALKKPSPQQVFTDLLETGQAYKSTSPSTYNLILKEGHIILRTHLYLCKNYDPEAESLFRKSCILLADYYACSLTSTEKHFAAAYYHLSKLPLEEVVHKILGFQSQIKHCGAAKTLVTYLNSNLLDQRCEAAEKLTKSAAESILDAYLEEAPENLWKVILYSRMSNYRVEKAMLMLKRRITTKRHLQTPTSISADTTAIVYLLLKKGNVESAQNMFLSVLKGDLVDVISDMHDLLWTDEGLTQLGRFTRKARPDAFIEMLVRMIKKKQTTVKDVLQMLQGESPNVSVTKIPQLKEFLENYWKECKPEFEEDVACQGMLLDIYLHRLENTGQASAPSKSSFSFRTRPRWLNMLPPFNGQAISRNCILNSKNGETAKTDAKEVPNCCCFNCNEDLIKVQCLLSHQKKSEVLLENLRFALSVRNSDDIKGYLSLDILSLDEEKATARLLETCPAAIFQYAIDTFKNDLEKWSSLVRTMCSKTESVSEENVNHETYTKTHQKILSHVAEIMSFPTLADLLQSQNKDAVYPYLKRCCDKHQADQLRNKIVALGNEIKLML